MPKIKTVSAVYRRKFNLGDYNDAVIEAAAWADIEEGEDPATAIAACFELAKGAVKEQALPLFKKANAGIANFIAGLPADVQATVPPTAN